MNKERKRLVRDLQRKGYVVELSGGGHLKIYKEGTKRKVFIPSTPSDSKYGYWNALRDLRRIGYRP